jgi:hypothetical protein
MHAAERRPEIAEVDKNPFLRSTPARRFFAGVLIVILIHGGV